MKEVKKVVLLAVFVIFSLGFVSADIVVLFTNQNATYQDGEASDGYTAVNNKTVSFKIGDDGSNYYRAFLDFDTSPIPDGSTINQVNVTLTTSAMTWGNTFQVIGLNQPSSAFTNAQLLTACGGGAGSHGIYNSSISVFNSGTAMNTRRNFTLNANATLNLSAQLSQDFFSICLYMLSDNPPGAAAYSDFHSNESTTAAYRPKLSVSYTPAAVPTLNTTLLYPLGNMAVQQNRFFNVTVNVTCLYAACGDVNVSLDPAAIGSGISGDAVVEMPSPAEAAPSGFFAKIWFYIKRFFRFTGHVTGGLVNTTIGATPFYTNVSNPLNSTNFPCLGAMTANSDCIVYWTVNATNKTGTYDFFAFANSTTLPALSIESQHISLTIQQEDMGPPLIAPISEFAPHYSAPTSQEWNGTIIFSANVTDDINVTGVWLNVSNSTSPNWIYPMIYIGNDSYSIELNATLFEFGIKFFNIYANDSYNKINATSLQNFTVADLLVPAIANISIEPTFPDPSTSVYINATVYDDYAVDSVWTEIVMPDGTRNNYSMDNFAGEKFGYVYTTSQRGRYTVYFYANDSYGNLRTTKDIPRYFYVPPVVLSDKDYYAQKQNISITGFGFSFNEDVLITIGNSTMNLTEFNTTSTGSGLIIDSYLIPELVKSGDYTIRAYDYILGVSVFKPIKIEGVVVTYPAGSIVIPGDDKQNPDAYDLDFLAMYGVVYDSLANTHKVDWVITPECVRLNATNADSAVNYNELFCHGFWLIKENITDALTYVNSVRGDVQILTLNEEARVPKAQIIQLRRAPKIAVLGGSQGQITSTLTRSNMPYTQLTDTDVMNDATFNIGTYDIILIGDYDFSKAHPRLASNISRFVNSGGYCHAEDEGAITLEAQTGFLGGLAEDGAYNDNIRIITASHPITQLQSEVFSNSYGTASVLDISGATNPYTVLIADGNNPPATNVKLVAMDVGRGFVTYSGGHIGSSQGSSELARPRNRILDNLLFFSTNVNDQSDPEVLSMTPMAAFNVTQFRAVNISAVVTDDAAVDSVWANVSWDSGSMIIHLSGPGMFSDYTYEFSNTTYVIDKNTPALYNVTFFANDSSGNIVNSSTYFFVNPDRIPYWENNLSSLPVSYSSSALSLFNITWLDDFAINSSSVLFESNFSGVSTNYSMNLISGNATNGTYNFSAVMPIGTYYWRVHARDEYGQWNSSEVNYFTIAPDTISPTIDFKSPTPNNDTIVSSNSLAVNISAYDLNLTNVTIYLYNSTGLVNFTNITAGNPFFVNFTNLPNGDYWFNATAIDIYGNTNSTETRNVYVDSTHPLVTINSPINTTYTSNSIFINISITNEIGNCVYSFDGGAANSTLTTSNSMEFTTTRTLANGAYVLYAYCSDIGGNRNDSVTVNFTVNYQSGGGGGGGGDCTANTWTCGEWSSCVSSSRTRTCTSNCDTTKTESEACVVCINECSEEKTYCDGSAVKQCAIDNGCYKITTLDTCTANESCVDAVCVENEIEEEPIIEVENPSDEVQVVQKKAGGWIPPNLTNPSSWIPHGNIPAPVVNAGMTAVAAGAGISLIWLFAAWILGMFIPLFSLKLKHYIVYVFDARNLLGMINNRETDRKKLLELLEDIAVKFEVPAFADHSEEIMRYVMKSGFIEARLDEPFIIIGHFTKRKHANKFEEVLRGIIDGKLGKEKGKEIKISRNVEKASIIRVVRAYFRKRKTEKQLKRAFKK